MEVEFEGQTVKELVESFIATDMVGVRLNCDMKFYHCFKETFRTRKWAKDVRVIMKIREDKFYLINLDAYDKAKTLEKLVA